MKDEREAKLPKWAQERLTKERVLRARAEASVKALFPDTETNTYWEESHDKRHPLPRNATVRFQLGPGEFGYIVVKIDEKEKAIYIFGLDDIDIRPKAMNAVWISPARLGQK